MKAQLILRGLLVFLSGIALQWITRQSPTPEQSNHLWYALPAFAIFALWFTSIFLWGSIFRRWLKTPSFSSAENALIDLSLGSVFFYLLSYALTPFGVFSSQFAVLLWLVPAAGFAMGTLPRPKINFGFILLGMIVVLKLLEGLQINIHGDAYITYLPAPRVWAETSSFTRFAGYSQYFLSTSFESLFAWGTTLMGLTGGHGLDLTQWFSQWVVGAVAVTGIFLASVAFCTRLGAFPIQSIFFPFIAITALQVSSLRWTANLAKNDLGVAYWASAAFYFSLYLAPLSAGAALAGGILLGAAAIGKITTGVFAVCVALWVLLRSRNRFLYFAVGGLLGILPVLLRNFILTQNPVFPWLPTVFPSPFLNDSVLEGSARATRVLFQWSNLGFYIKEFVDEIPLCISLILMMGLKKFRRPILEVITVPLIAMIAFTFTFRAATEIRYQGAVLVCFAIFSAYFTFFFAQLITQKWPNRFTRKLGFAIAILMLAYSNLSFFSFFQLGHPKFFPWPKRALVMDDVGGPGKWWIRSNLKPTDSILVAGDGYPYYLLDYSATPYSQLKGYERLVAEGKAKAASELFKKSPYQYLYLSSKADFVPYQPVFAQVIEFTRSWKQSCKRFEHPPGQTPTVQVWDLGCLK